MEKIGIFGGSFNPIHVGHVHLAKSYIRALSLDKLLVIPAKYPPHKQSRDLAPGKTRLALCRLAFEDCPQVEVSDLELSRPGRSYTIDTVQELRRRYPDAELYLIVGGDMFRSFSRWWRFEDILLDCGLCTAPRDSKELEELRRSAILLGQYSEKVQILDIPPIELSSTEIRRRLAAGEDCQGLLPPKVEAEIQRLGLYRPDPDHKAKVAQYTEAIRQLLKPRRFEHSLNVAQRAAALALLYEEDDKKAELAGLLHDCCKNMPQEEQLHWLQKSAIIFDKSFLEQPPLWHGFAAAEYVRCRFGIEDEDLLNALRYHTVGRANMSPLEKIVYLADLTSAERDYPDVDSVRETVDRSLEEGLRVSLLFTLGKLLQNGQPICRDCWEAYNCYVPRRQKAGQE